MNNRQQYLPEQENIIVDALRRTLDKTKHHEKFGTGARFAKVLRQELSGAFNVDSMCISTSPTRIEIWGQGADMNNSFCLHGGLGWEYHLNVQPWHAKIAKEVDIKDGRDCQERRRQEQDPTVRVVLAGYDGQVAGLLARIDEVRRDAAKVISDLPEPKSATIRKGHGCWKRPSSALTEQFPNLFKS